jgi:hypothetical protein
MQVNPRAVPLASGSGTPLEKFQQAILGTLILALTSCCAEEHAGSNLGPDSSAESWYPPREFLVADFGAGVAAEADALCDIHQHRREPARRGTAAYAAHLPLARWAQGAAPGGRRVPVHREGLSQNPRLSGSVDLESTVEPGSRRKKAHSIEQVASNA